MPPDWNLAILKAAFCQFDRSQDGFLSADDIRDGLGRTGIASSSVDQVNQMIAEGDVDHDGKISFEEFVEVMRSPSAAEKYRGFPILKAAFCFIDKSGNARISIPELGKSMTGLGFPMDREEVVKVFRDIDKNGDNSIDFREFEKAFGQFM